MWFEYKDFEVDFEMKFQLHYEKCYITFFTLNLK